MTSLDRIRRTPSLWIFLCGLLTISHVAATVADEADSKLKWVRDLDEGLELAKVSNRDVLVNFTGHGWCFFCELLDKQVFRQPEFAATTDHFVLVELNFPAKSPDETDLDGQARIKKYRGWQDQYLAQGVPTVVLMDSDAKPFAYSGYAAGVTAKSFLDDLAKYRIARVDRDRAFKETEKLTGIERAKRLDAALDCVEPFLGDLENRKGDSLLVWYKDVIEEICRLDADDSAGLRSKYTKRKQRLTDYAGAQQLFEKMQKIKESKDALEYIAEVLPTVSDPTMRWRLEVARQWHLARDTQYETAIEQARSLLTREDLDRDQQDFLKDRIAFNLKNLGQLQEAAVVLDQLISSNQDRPSKQQRYRNFKAWYWDGSKAGDRSPAIAAFLDWRSHCETHSDDWETATWGLGMQYQKAGQFRDALNIRQELVDWKPEPESLADMAESQLSLKLFAVAADSLRRAEDAANRLEDQRQDQQDRKQRLIKRIEKLKQQSSDVQK